MTHRRHSLAASILVLALPSMALGQSGQYTAPGAQGAVPENRGEALQRAAEDARWRVGALRLDPWVSLRDVTYEKRDGEESVYTAGIGAGLRGYVPFSSKLVAAAYVLPEYLWRSDEGSDSRLAGRAGVGLSYVAPRVQAELAMTKSDQNVFASSEVNRRAEVVQTLYGGRVDVTVFRKLGVYGFASRYDQGTVDPEPGAEDLGNLDAFTDSLGGGIFWQVTPDLRFSVGAGTSETTFDDSVRDLSNDGEFVSGRLEWNRSKLGADVAVYGNDLSPTLGSGFAPFDATTWSGRIHWSPRSSFTISLYGLESLSYSVDLDQTTYLDERIGLRVEFPIGHRLRSWLFYENGQNDYQDGSRQDDVTSWGGSISTTLWKRFSIGVGGRSTRIESEQQPDSTYSDFGLRVALSLGSGQGTWY